MGRLCQVVGNVLDGKGQRILITDIFYVINCIYIPSYRQKEITYTLVVCKVFPQESDPNHTLITINGNQIFHPGDVGTPMGSLSIVKLVINSVLSGRVSKLVCFDIKTSTSAHHSIERWFRQSSSLGRRPGFCHIQCPGR